MTFDKLYSDFTEKALPLAAQEERKKQDAYIAEEGCEDVGLRSILQLQPKGKEFVYGSSSNNHSRA